MRNKLITVMLALAIIFYGMMVYAWIEEGNQNFETWRQEARQ